MTDLIERWRAVPVETRTVIIVSLLIVAMLLNLIAALLRRR